MDVMNLGSILRAAEGLVLPFRHTLEEEDLDRAVNGVKLYQPGLDLDYANQMVLVPVRVVTQAELNAVLSQCGGAASIILQPETPPELRAERPQVLLRRSSWVTAETLLRVLFVISQSTTLPGGTTSRNAEMIELDSTLIVQRRESALLALLHGTSDAASPAAFLGLRPDRDHVVIAVGIASVEVGPLRKVITDELSGENSVVSDGVLFAVLLVKEFETLDSMTKRIRSRILKAITPSCDLPIGVGSKVPGVYRLHESASVAREILRALCFKLGKPALSDRGMLRVAMAHDVDDALALIRAGDILRSQGDTLSAPLILLSDYDREHGSELLTTVLVALVNRHNVAEAARILGIHANSLRARLERIRELSGIDLSAPVSSMRTMMAFLANPDVHNEARPLRP